MNGPEDREQKIEIGEPADPRMAEFEQALARAMKRVEVPAHTAAKLQTLAEQAERNRAHAGSFRLLKFSNGGARIFAISQPRAWMGGAIAAVLAMGCFVGARLHVEHERRIRAERQFETAERITDETLARTREQLAQRGFQWAP